MPPSGAAKQKPNDACACGSGAKFKRCCGGAGSAPPPGSAALPRTLVTAPLTPSERKQLQTRIQRARAEAKAAEEVGDLARATRRCVTGLGLCADAWADGAGARSIVEETVLFFDLLIEYYSRQGRLEDAEDAHKRGLRLVAEPPMTPFWARALMTPGFAAWRDDEPLPPVDARCVVPLETALLVNPGLLHELHISLGLAYSRAGGLKAQAVAAFEAALDALRARVPPSPNRDVTEAGIVINIGNQHFKSGDLAACAAKFDEAAALLARKGGSEAVAVRRAGLAAHLEMNRASLVASQRADRNSPTCTDAELEPYEQAWALFESRSKAEMASQWADAEGSPVGVCCAALGRSCTVAQLTRWVRRACVLPGVVAASNAAAALACRFCSAPPPHGDKLQRCGGCGRVCYCGPACQREDWKRHKAECAARAPEPTCVMCNLPLLTQEMADNPEAGLTGNQQVFMLLGCLHFTHRHGSIEATDKQCPKCANAAPR
jgi:hypothetical protein